MKPPRSPLVAIADRLRRDLAPLAFAPPVAHVYDPLDYGWRAHVDYLERFGVAPRDVLIVGMNPSYWGMVQTGVPFGDVVFVRDWLGIRTPVGTPRDEHPKRPIVGFACHRREASGMRFWGWARERYGEPRRFFARFFVTNYCPLAFLAASGANRGVDALPAAERVALFAVCDRALRANARALGVRCAVGIGRFAEQRVAAVLGGAIACGGAPHPSPANPGANRGWAEQMDRALAALGIAP